jgi:hypothetical protein
VRVALWRLGVPFGVREQVCTLVRCGSGRGRRGVAGTTAIID